MKVYWTLVELGGLPLLGGVEGRGLAPPLNDPQYADVPKELSGLTRKYAAVVGQT